MDYNTSKEENEMSLRRAMREAARPEEVFVSTEPEIVTDEDGILDALDTSMNDALTELDEATGDRPAVDAMSTRSTELAAAPPVLPPQAEQPVAIIDHAENARSKRAQSASTAADSIRKMTEKAIEVLTARRDALMDKLRADHAQRAADATAAREAAEKIAADALEVSRVNSEKANMINAEATRDVQETEALINNETARYNEMLTMQRDVLMRLNGSDKTLTS